MIRRIKVRNFKSLDDFEISGMGKWVCLVGMNGAGKTTFLQLLDFLGSAMEGDASRCIIGGHVAPIREMVTGGSGRRNIEIQLDTAAGGKEWKWDWTYNAYEGRTVRESLSVRAPQNSEEWKPCFRYPDKATERVLAKGSALAQVMELTADADAFRRMLAGIVVLGVLDPEAIASPTQVSARNVLGIERNGKGLTAYISSLSPTEHADFERNVVNFYGAKGIDKIEVKGQRFGWKRLWFQELGKSLDAVHLSYGTLRYMAMAALKYGKADIVAFDEVENGFNQEVMTCLLDLFRSYENKQVVVTTHSGLLLNYFTDEEALASVFFLYKDSEHKSRAVRFFDIPGKKADLAYQGAGETFSVTDLRQLAAVLQRKGDAE